MCAHQCSGISQAEGSSGRFNCTAWGNKYIIKHCPVLPVGSGTALRAGAWRQRPQAGMRCAHPDVRVTKRPGGPRGAGLSRQ